METTEQRLEDIRQLREEIMWIESESSMSDGYPYPAAVRILARLEELLAAKSAALGIEVAEANILRLAQGG